MVSTTRLDTTRRGNTSGTQSQRGFAGAAVLEVQPMCEAMSPAGNLPCSRVDCDGRGHVWVHASSARDPKADAEALLDL